jgi:16S rRNA (cytidine1402-2'-O)-methyltransferase
MTYQAGSLAVVSTPIGNLGDLSSRAAATLARADIVACEDTRMTRKLLTLCGIKTNARLLAYHDHNGHNMRPKLIAEMTAGKMVALVSDAGTPLVSDPGYKLVAACHDAGIGVTTMPGPSAVLAALAGAGLPSDRFLFAGFVPQGKSAAQNSFREFADLAVTSIWFDSAKRLAANLRLMHGVFGNRQAVVARELTKLYEDYRRDSLEALVNHYATAPTVKGEIVILVSGAPREAQTFDDDALEVMLREELRDNSLRDAVKTVTEVSGKPRKHVYALAIDIDRQTP